VARDGFVREHVSEFVLGNVAYLDVIRFRLVPIPGVAVVVDVLAEELDAPVYHLVTLAVKDGTVGADNLHTYTVGRNGFTSGSDRQRTVARGARAKPTDRGPFGIGSRGGPTRRDAGR
jgi:hypothetical protein